MKNVVEQLAGVQEQHAVEMNALLETLTATPEIAGAEVKGAAAIRKVLERHGFRTTERFEGYASALLAEYTTGPGPKVVFLAKYDALPGFDHGKDAHGCGHNWVGTLSVAAAVVLSKFAAEFSGTIAVVGAPTETFFGDGVSIRTSAYFDDAAAVFHSHLNDRNLLYSFPLPINTLELTFTGKSSQAFSYPEEGINALDAAVATIEAIRTFKSAAQEFDRINYIIAEGGRSAELIPNFCILRAAIGGAYQLRTEELTAQVISMAERSAKALGATVRATVVNRFPTLANDRALHELIAECFTEISEPYDTLPARLGRTALDVASISMRAPMLYMFFGVPNWISHQPTLSRIDASHAEPAKRRLGAATRIFASAGLKILTDAGLRARIAADWRNERRALDGGTSFSIERFAQ